MDGRPVSSEVQGGTGHGEGGHLATALSRLVTVSRHEGESN